MTTIRLSRLILALAALVATAAAATAGPAQFVIVNVNAPNVGFNDPTPAAPVGGNAGTTLGQQRLIAFEHAAAIWSARLDSAVPIRIRAQFTPLAAGVLGSAGTTAVAANFLNAPLQNTGYHIALANKLAGLDLAPTIDDINANFSTNFTFYLGLDNNHGPLPDLVTVLLHEFAHGLGFSQFASLTSGALFGGRADVYNTRLFDAQQGLFWPQMTNAQRVTSATTFGRVVLDFPRVTADVPKVLVLGSPTVQADAPAAIAGPFQFGTAAFGPLIGNPTVSASVVAAVDAIETIGGVTGTTTDGCSPFANAAAVAGKIALVERGLCGFALKARNASAAGAAAVVIYNNVANVNAAPPGMADDGVNGAFVTIPAVSLRRADGLSIAAATAPSMTLGIDPTVRAGADALNRARVFAPFPVQGGSSISHYDTVAFHNLLMEPAINGDLTHKVKAPDDLTLELLLDEGWTSPDADGDGFADDEDCNPNSDTRKTIIIGDNDSGVPNTLFGTGCTSSDLIAQIKAGAANHGGFVSGVAQLTNAWVASNIISGRQKGAVQSAAARSGF
ncbi:MAG TPA: PA domain-containing protein [Vicinamibacterales bacterium]|nr:PA domain-containing protein [Vicinamibacterales bacterium]